MLAIGVTAATHTSLTPLLLAAALALGTACLHAYVDATHPPVLGPFYSYERRTGACARPGGRAGVKSLMAVRAHARL